MSSAPSCLGTRTQILTEGQDKQTTGGRRADGATADRGRRAGTGRAEQTEEVKSENNASNKGNAGKKKM